MKMMSANDVDKMKYDVNIVIGHQIMLLRKSCGLSGKLLAKKIGVSQQQISRYERGVCKIDIDALILLLNYLNESLEDFFIQVSMRLKNQDAKNYEKYQMVFQSTLDSLCKHDFFEFS